VFRLADWESTIHQTASIDTRPPGEPATKNQGSKHSVLKFFAANLLEDGLEFFAMPSKRRIADFLEWQEATKGALEAAERLGPERLYAVSGESKEGLLRRCAAGARRWKQLLAPRDIKRIADNSFFSLLLRRRSNVLLLKIPPQPPAVPKEAKGRKSISKTSDQRKKREERIVEALKHDQNFARVASKECVSDMTVSRIAKKFKIKAGQKKGMRIAPEKLTAILNALEDEDKSFRAVAAEVGDISRMTVAKIFKEHRSELKRRTKLNLG
jgi:hypothetical protein